MSLQRNKRVVIAALLLLCTRCDGNAVQPQKNTPRSLCNKPEETLVTLSEPHLNSSGPIRLNISAGHFLNITMQRLPGDPVCNWTHGVSPVRGGYCMIIPLTSQSDTGNYTFSCERSNSTLTLVLNVGPLLRKPSRPDLKIVEKGPGYLPEFQCSSDGHPTPIMEWCNNLDQRGFISGMTVNSEDPERVISKLGMKNYITETVMCCSINTKGVACSHLYDYDLDREFNDNNEASEIIVKPGHSLLLRCRIKIDKTIVTPIWLTHAQDHVFIRDTTYKGQAMTYLYIESLAANHSGIYTCTSSTKIKTTNIRVLEKGFISFSPLKESYTISAQEKPEFCLQPQVSSHPPLQCCYWLGPNKTLIKCPDPTRSWKNRTLDLCNADKGMYQLHLETEEQNLTIYTSLCVTDTPTFNLYKEENLITCETITPLPFTLTWLSSHLPSQLQPAWKNQPSTILEQSDSDQYCHQKVRSSLSTDDLKGDDVEGDDVEGEDVEGDDVEGDDVEGDDVEGDDVEGDDVEGDDVEGDDVKGDDVEGDDVKGDDVKGDDMEGDDVKGYTVKCCITNSAYSRLKCSDPLFIPATQHSYLWKVGCPVLLLVLTLVVITLFYFIRKKKKKYCNSKGNKAVFKTT